MNRKSMWIVASMMLATAACAATNSQSAVTIAPSVHTQAASAQSCGTLPCNTSQVALSPSEGSPMPVCQPGHQCNDNQLRNIASEGSPMPVCQPGHQCNDNQLRNIASEGSPMPVCQPGHQCNDNQEKFVLAL